MDAKEARLRFALLTAEVNSLHESYHLLPDAQRIGPEGKTIRQQLTALGNRLRDIDKTIKRKHYSRKII